MPDDRSHYSAFTIKVNGKQQDAIITQVDSVVIEQNLHLPDAVTISLRDAGESPLHTTLNLELANGDKLPIGADVEIAMGREKEPKTLFKGEITAHEVDISTGQAPRLIVRGYDKSHRLQRGRQSRTYTNMTDSDIAGTVARENGLQVKVDATPQVHPYVLQNNQTNFEFLQARAQRIGYEFFVDGAMLHFVKPRTDAASSHQLELWKDLLHLHLRQTSTAQVKDVTVHSWDPQTKEKIVGRSTKGAPTSRDTQLKSGAELAKPFGQATMQVATRPVSSQADADTLAKAVADDLAGSAVHVEGKVNGNPSLAPGQMINLSALGARFAGDYYVTTATHRVGADQMYTTAFTVSGKRSHTLRDLVAASAAPPSHGGASAVVIGVVTNNTDPENQGRVKVKMPWLGDTESDWARLVGPGGGKQRGFFWLPEVDDEVLVAFEHGDAHRPFVIGALWNGKDAPPKGNSDVTGGGSVVNERIIKSRSGHVITLDDTENTERITVQSKSGHKIILDDKKGGERISVLDKSDRNTIVIDTTTDKITVHAQGDLELVAERNVTLRGLSVSISAQTSCSITATADVSVTGMPIKLN